MKDFPNLNRTPPQRWIRKKTESPGKSRIKLVLTWIFLVLVAMFFVQQRIEFIRTERKVRELNIEKRKINSSILPLKLEERHLTRLPLIEKAAEVNYQLQHPRASQVIKVRIAKKETGAEN